MSPHTHTHHYQRSTPVSVGLGDHHPILHIVGHLEPHQSHVAHYRQLQTVDPVGVGGEVVECGYVTLCCPTAIDLERKEGGREGERERKRDEGVSRGALSVLRLIVFVHPLAIATVRQARDLEPTIM